MPFARSRCCRSQAQENSVAAAGEGCSRLALWVIQGQRGRVIADGRRWLGGGAASAARRRKGLAIAGGGRKTLWLQAEYKEVTKRSLGQAGGPDKRRRAGSSPAIES